ncbi:protein mono-ADP-ribosyltransferase PARP10 [Talpa occidentalis]|uniref:protein mono-ADP-ribosyltransferase PARP10 n=1 Tax=Talpa occidentalis TaxID=50954 RepID=UPI00188F8C8D|nr:protein mono-ADP-ribosyltransferase PARP10 [Talpa occidentalis]
MARAEEPAEAAVELSGLPPDGADELLTLYFENRRRSGGGPVRSWRRLGGGGILTFWEPADAARVLAREHELQGARLRLRPAPPRAPARLLLQGLPLGAAPRSLELHVQALLRAAGHPEQPCRALDSPRPDRALVQLSKPLSEAELLGLEEQARSLRLEGAAVSLTAVPQARAVRVVRATSSVDLLLLELYLENQGRSGGGALEGLRSLPGLLGTVVSFQEWQAAERVLQREHELQGTVLSFVPHYDVLEPEDPSEDIGARGHLTEGEPGVPKPAPPEARGPAEVPTGAGTVPTGSEQAPGPPATPTPACPAELPAPAGPVGSVGAPGWEGPGRPGPEASPGQGGLVDVVLPMEPGALRFLRLYHEDLLADLGDVALFPLEGSTVTGFRLCGAPGPCRAAEEFLQCLLGSVSCHLLSLGHPGSASFLLSLEGQQLLRGLEARFRCAFGTERLATAVLEATESVAEDPTEALQALPGQPLTPWPPDDAGSDQENVSLGEMRELLAALDSCLPLERGEEMPAGRPEEAPGTSSPGAPGRLEEEAELQLALHRSLEPPGREAKQEEVAALRRALALSLLEPPPPGAVGFAGGGPGSQAQLEVHVAFEQDVEELERALGAALEEHLREEAVGPGGHLLPSELQARLERFHRVSVALRGDCTVLRGFGAQPARAARHLAALLAGAPAQSPALPVEAPGLRQRLKEPPGGLECLAEGSREFREVVQAFYDTLDDARSRVRIIRVQRVRHPLLQQQYEAHLGLLEQRCERRPVERVLYHGTSAAAVPDICAHGFNRSFCGRNGTLYGRGVYFAERAALSVQDCYSPPAADGLKAVFVARVLTGDFGQGHPGLRAPPLRAADDALLRFDSAVDRLDRPRVFVIFHDTQALPTHLITCRRLPRAPPSGLSGPAAATCP